MKVLLIDNYDSFTYNIVEVLRQLNIKEISIVKNNEISVDQARQFDKIIISPGPATPSESGNILEIIEALAPSHSILGICLGHQAIAEVFGGQLRNMSHPYHGYQTQLEILKPHKIFSFDEGIQKLKVGLYHSWVVEETNFPDSLEITSKSTEDHIMSFKHKTFDVHGVQFHPESYMTVFGKEIIAGFLN